MKKNYSIFLFSIMLSAFSFAQSSSNQSEDERMPYIASPVSQTVRSLPQQNGTTQQHPIINEVLTCDTLSTSFNENNGQAGVMFDLIAITDILINGFTMNLNGTGYYTIYYKAGTYFGNETTPGVWTFIDSVQITPNGMNIPTPVPINVNVSMNAGDTVGFYITGNTGSALYYTGTNTMPPGSEQAVYSSNANLAIVIGKGVAFPFGPGLYTPRLMNGIVDYCTLPLTIPAIESENNLVTVYPNPLSTTAKINIENSSIVKDAQMKIYNSSGDEVRSVVNINSHEIILDRKSLAAGLYFFEVADENKIIGNGKFVIE